MARTAWSALAVTSIALGYAAAGAPLTVSAQPAEESVQAFNDRMVEQLRKKIAGKESRPASEVFENIQIELFKTVPAERLLGIMNRGYSRALGVKCTHCHMEDDFASDDMREKQAAREMAAMHKAINDQLAKMKHLEGTPEDRFINCSTCHRGKVDPHDAPR
jgi:hypothetical protein